MGWIRPIEEINDAGDADVKPIRAASLMMLIGVEMLLLPQT